MAVAHWCGPGKILTLLDLIGEHERAFVYDWRTRFGLPLEAVFDGRMTWAETWNLTMELVSDPSSHVAASMAGWSYPMDRAALIGLETYDLLSAVNLGKRHQPHRAPWDTSERLGKASPEVDVRAVLRPGGLRD